MQSFILSLAAGLSSWVPAGPTTLKMSRVRPCVSWVPAEPSPLTASLADLHVLVAELRHRASQLDHEAREAQDREENHRVIARYAEANAEHYRAKRQRILDKVDIALRIRSGCPDRVARLRDLLQPTEELVKALRDIN